MPKLIPNAGSGPLTVSSLTVTSLTNPKIPFAGPGGLLIDSALEYTSANLVSQINGANAQAMRIYGNATNYLEMKHSGAAARINTTAGSYFFQVAGTDYAGINAGSIFPNSAGLIDLGVASLGFKRLYLDFTNSATTGSQTISKATGSFQIAAAASTATITNTLCTANTVVQAFLMTVDATAKTAVAVPGAGSFVVTLNANATAQVKVGFLLINTD